jgi:diaminopimelate epimerase
MITVFNKYQGAGNDFIIIDNRKGFFNADNHELINRLCDRRFGIGADGLILICSSHDYDFEMKYFNSDGKEGSMCGNGGRCSAAFAVKEGIAEKEMYFKAADGVHKASMKGQLITLSMNDVRETKIINGNYFINTGSPHYIIFSDDIENIDVSSKGKEIRMSPDFSPGGTNVNFVQITKTQIFVRTFERGVEAETLSCGTGVTASAIASVLAGHFDSNNVSVRTKGGDLTVSFNKSGKEVTDIRLTGPATFVFEGMIEV